MFGLFVVGDFVADFVVLIVLVLLLICCLLFGLIVFVGFSVFGGCLYLLDFFVVF